MKVTASVLIAAAAIAPALAYGFEAEDSLVTRDDNEFASAYGRGLELDLNEREFDEELYQREPFRGMGRNRFRGGNRHHHHGESAPSTPTSEGQNERREYNDDLFEREFDEELYQREPFRGKGMFRGARNGLRSGNRHHHHSESAPSTPSSETQNERREFDDDLLEREFDEELYQREPIRGMGRIRTSQSGNRHHLHHSRPPAVEAQNERREFDDELMEREYDSELFEREPEPLFGFIKKWFNKKKAPAPDAEAPEARDFDELD
jgi:hypothetical protein